MNREQLVKDFQVACNRPVDQDIENRDRDLMHLCLSLIEEEYAELKDEVYAFYLQYPRRNKAKLLKELADLQYVVSFFAATFGLPLEEAFKEVHGSNLTKLDENGNAILREDGKIMKSANYQAPDMEKVLEAKK